MDIAVIEKEIRAQTTHVELQAQTILSVLASITPFSDNNQSPRNMYQCQMLKQAMGLPAINMFNRADNKSYQLLNPQTPLVKNDNYTKYNMDDYAAGTNCMFYFIFFFFYFFLFPKIAHTHIQNTRKVTHIHTNKMKNNKI